jgi:hypothetical protein
MLIGRGVRTEIIDGPRFGAITGTSPSYASVARPLWPCAAQVAPWPSKDRAVGRSVKGKGRARRYRPIRRTVRNRCYVLTQTHAPQQTLSYSITSLARASSVAGTVRPSVTLGSLCNPITGAPGFTGVPCPASASRCPSELPCTRCVLAANGNGRTNFSGSGHAASQPNQVGMTERAAGDLDLELVGAITGAPLCDER